MDICVKLLFEEPYRKLIHLLPVNSSVVCYYWLITERWRLSDGNSTVTTAKKINLEDNAVTCNEKSTDVLSVSHEHLFSGRQ